MPPQTKEKNMPRSIWMGLPILLALLPGTVNVLSNDTYTRWIRTEFGLIELATALFLGIAVFNAAWVLRLGAHFPRPWLRVWFGTFLMGCVYFLGEEISWGQHLFGWDSPTVFAANNDQGETNLHNLGGWLGTLLDQAPRSALTLAALVGGFIGPLGLRKRRLGWDINQDLGPWIWPTRIAIPAALGALLITLPRKLLGKDLPDFWAIQAGESKEAFLALFLWIAIETVRRTAQGAITEVDPVGSAS